MNRKGKEKFLRYAALFMSINVLTQVCFPTVSWALTSGPSQPEVQSFEPVSTTEMVDLFTGDFNYNIPLFELPGPNGGYPFNMHYNSGIAMDQEASWVGLGWNINPGAITRQMRGLPDELNGQAIKQVQYMKPNVTIGLGISGSVEVFGGDAEVGLSAGLGISVYYNSYKGAGYSISTSLGCSSQLNEGIGGGIGLNVSLDSQEGIGVNASLSMSDHASVSGSTYSMGLGYNSHEGLTSVSTGISNSSHKWANFNTTLSVNSNGYIPYMANAMTGKNVNLQVKVGGHATGMYFEGALSGYYHSQKLTDLDKEISIPAFGYMNLQNTANNPHAMQDFNREKDGMIHKNSPNLPIPVTTYDIYSVNGHGIAGMYRPFRNDIGVLRDPTVNSSTSSGALSLEVGIGLGPEVGVDLSVNIGSSVSGPWSSDNNVAYAFSGYKADSDFEPFYFKLYGEHSVDSPNELKYVGGDEPVSVSLTKSSGDPVAGNTIRKWNNSAFTSPQLNDNSSETRESRSNIMQPVNEDYSFSKGLYALNQDGSTYVYGQPEYNNKHVECSYSAGAQGSEICDPVIKFEVVDGKPAHKHSFTDQYYKRTELPSYAHSFLLTQVLGADYVDADGDGQPSDGDFGYWVKFKYKQTSTTYKWRTPFAGASYSKGLHTTFEDDKGSYIYGEKEVWYLEKAETKTHIAIFNTSQRMDARGASDELQNTNSVTGIDPMGDYSYKLDNIKLYTKAEYNTAPKPTPIKSVYFQYSYKLCPGVRNNSGANDTYGTSITSDERYGTVIPNTTKGKLTLEKVWFTYENNKKGRLSPYEFDYNADVPAENPGYNYNLYDRWGYYKPYENSASVSVCKNTELPYVPQFNTSNPDDPTFRTKMNTYMAVWNMKKITLPSGGKISVTYEADDYAYVQNKTAMQMFPIESLSPGFGKEGHIFHPKFAGGKQRRVYFKLEKPIATNDVKKLAKLNKYFDKTGKVYFKAYMKILTSGDDRQDYVSGYCDVAGKGFDESSTVTNNSISYYTRAYVELDEVSGGNGKYPYHPFSVAAWQYIRTDNPALNGVGPYKSDPNSSKSAAINQLKSLVSVVPQIIQMFQGIHDYAYQHNWGEQLLLERSFIRLNSPDKIKIGGGVRVKKIVLSDEWNDIGSEQKSEYGQVYDYTIQENGEEISSGVATYEPMIGGDETALRSVKEYPQKIPLKTNNRLYFELPVNESYFPGASVGYRQVTVKSLATHYAQIEGAADPHNIPQGILTTGAVVHEFYTAREFPVVVAETPIQHEKYDIYVPIPLIGTFTKKKRGATQGYVVTLNDMHGKPKQTSTYGQDKSGNIVYDAPLTQVKYNYHSTKVPALNEFMENPFFILNNEVPVLLSDRNGQISKGKRVIGQEFEFFVDMREMRTESTTGGVAVNLDIIMAGVVPVPIPVPWPRVDNDLSLMRTVVTNKIIHRSGILKSIEAYDEGSYVLTENKLYDYQTGTPVLTSTTNHYDDPVYDYNLPLHHAYTPAGAAYKNIGLRFSTNLASAGSGNSSYTLTPSGAGWGSRLIEGDSLAAAGERFVVEDVTSSTVTLTCVTTTNPIASGTKNFVVVHSGYKNLLDTKAGSLRTLGEKGDTAKGNPTVQANRKF